MEPTHQPADRVKVLESKLQTMSDQIQRFRLSGNLGLSFGGARDMYDVLGYRKNLRPDDYFQIYRRQDIASRIVRAFPQATWRSNPIIAEGDDETETEFERAIRDLDDRLGLWGYCERADRLSGIGRYGLLILGVNDGARLSDPLMRASEINWLKAVKEQNAEVVVWNQDPTDPDFGKPLEYNVTFGDADNQSIASVTRRVHASRVIHIAEFLEEDEVFGVPRLESVFNRLQDLEKVVGGSAEMYWLGARNGLKMIAQQDANLSPAEIDRLEEMAEDYQHSIRRTLAAQGVDIESLGGHTPDPSSNVTTILQLISGATGIPTRILIGSERGELASSQDETAWLGRIDERRVNFVEPNIIRPLLTRLMELGVIPSSKDYRVEWEQDDGLGEKVKAEIGEIKARALSHYANSMDAARIVPEREFREVVLGLEPEPDGGFPEELPDIEPEPLSPDEQGIIDNACNHDHGDGLTAFERKALELLGKDESE